jgi:dethiobiotin synthetase
MSAGYFITGTDTGIGKTFVSCALLHAFAAHGKTVAGMKPVAAGCENGKWDDVEKLHAASNIKISRQQLNPYALNPPLAPHIAAKQANIEIDLSVIQQAYLALSSHAEVVIVEGVGGFLVPLNAQQDGADLAQVLGLPVILVVGMRLGCLNHALLTAKAIQVAGLSLVGWVANCIDPHMMALEENINTLVQRIDCPLLGEVPFDGAMQDQQLAGLLDISKLAQS